MVNVQVKSVDAPAASVLAPPVKEAHLPPPLTATPVSEAVPVLVSVTTMVAVPPTAALEPLAGVELFSVKEVDVVRPVRLPDWCSPVAGAGVPNWSVPTPSAVQALAPAVIVKVQ